MTMTLPRISVALCTYNGARYLKEQLDSILIQTRLPDDLLVCDDGSKDATLDILEDFRKTASFPVRIVRNEQNLKMTKNFEKCIGLCSGDFIVPCDFDDAWYPNKLEIFSRALENDDKAGYVCCNADLMDDEGLKIPGTLWNRLGFAFLSSTKFPARIDVAMLLKRNVVWGSAMMLRSSVRKYVLPISGRWVQDAWIALISSFAGSYGIAFDQSLMKYRIHATQAHGVHPKAWHLLPHLRSTPSDIWEKELAKLFDVRDSIRAQHELLNKCRASDLKLLDEKIAHLTNRDALRSSSGVKLWRGVLAELSTGRYDRFSLGLKSAVRDLLM